MDNINKIALQIKKLAAPRTFKVARQEILDHLNNAGWNISDPTLKIPHATSPDGTLRLWFKAQAVYYTKSNEKKHKPKDARTVSYDLDIRKVSPQNFLDWIEKIDEKGLLQPREK